MWYMKWRTAGFHNGRKNSIDSYKVKADTLKEASTTSWSDNKAVEPISLS